MVCLTTEFQSEDVVLAEDFKTLKSIENLSEKRLCIVKTDFKNLTKIKNFFERYPDIKVWLTSTEISRKNILAANLNGFSDIVQYPVNPQLVSDFLEDKKEVEPENDKIETDFSQLPYSKIMIVDDNPMNVDLLAETLKCPQFELFTFLKPIDAIKLLDKEKFDLFLLDVMMPDISGFDLASIIKKSEKNSEVPIMFVSALSDSETKIKGYSLGSCAFIEKPFDINVVKAQIFSTLKTKNLQETNSNNKETYVALVTHDLKTPVNAEIAALEYLLKNNNKNMDTSQTQIIGNVLDAAKYMKNLVDNIMHKYRYENGVTSLKPTSFLMDNLVIECIEETKYLFEDKNLKIKYTCSTKNNEITLDYLEIKRVIHNLMTNSSEYATKNSEIQIKLKADDNFVYFSIKNDGIGIDLENPDEIFEKHVTFASKHKKMGNGLGLYVARKIIEAHNGKIFVKSKVNEFTEFSFILPKNMLVNNAG